MIKFQIISIVLLSFLAFSCKKDKDKLPECPACNFTCLDGTEQDIFTNDCISNWTCQYDLHDNSKLEYISNANHDEALVKSGDKLVFETILNTQGTPNIADDEVTKTLYFEIDPTQESFSVEGDQLDLLNVRYQKSCFCSDVHFNKPSSGCMQGQKIDENHWQVQANLVIPWSTVSLDARLDAVFSR